MPSERLICAFIALLTVLALCLAAPAAVFASGGNGSIELICKAGGGAVSGVGCSLYEVAAINGTDYELTSDFASSAVRLNGLTSESEWQSAADSLETYLQTSGKAAAQSKTTGEDGSAAFTGLSGALYLAVFARRTSGSKVYSFSAALLAVPGRNGDGSENWKVTAYPKGSETDKPSGKTDITVVKVWNDGAYAALRPAQITVTLAKNGTVYDSVQLDAQNNWRWSWKGLDAEAVWSAAESGVPSGYTVTYDRDGSVLTITNTRTPETQPPETQPPVTTSPETLPPVTTAPTTTAPVTTAPVTTVTTAVTTSAGTETTSPQTTAGQTTAPETSAPQTSAPETTGTPEEEMVTPPTPLNPGESEETTVPAETTAQTEILTENVTPGAGLPATGQVRWPVPVLAACGIALLAAGMYLKARERHDKK